MSYEHHDIWNHQHIHDDVIKWKHFPRYWPFVQGIHRSPVNSLHKGQWRGAFVFSLICTWMNLWVDNREAGDLRRYHAHYDVIVMLTAFWWLVQDYMKKRFSVTIDKLRWISHLEYSLCTVQDTCIQGVPTKWYALMWHFCDRLNALFRIPHAVWLIYCLDT